MSLIATSNAVFTTVADTFRTRTKFLRLTAKGLRASTKYTITLDGIDYAWATKQDGKNLGEDLISDAEGELFFGILIEHPYNDNYTADTIHTELDLSERLNTQKIKNNYRVSSRLLELRAGDSYTVFQLPYRIILVDDKPNRIDEGL
jgi:hypothetical protein